MIAADDFDPTTWPAPAPAACYLHLSDRFDVYALVDPEDHAWASRHRWCHTYGSGSICERFEGVFVIDRPDGMYARRCVGGRTLWLHREILIRKDGPPGRGRWIGDHRNGNTLDCRRRNLRWATPSQNARNVPGSRTRTRFLKMMEAAE
ncbi:hypothetical protein AOPFMNJM_1685 [Methylobacterium jeotgali]|uniref:HNH nuclease domain-containing protein n=4 Tax=Pseudomonadota TaxID=1224 RepID=A0ABQ4SX36_9HYPH|nr:HNH endonuclease [Methylobacterium jeotgali]GJE06369.1 hypothetical protein AOPFMNJM_1685 [Methylobacterium jeotgali]